MAKKSAIQKNLKRMKMAGKFEKKRAKLKKIIMNKKLELAERFAAQLELEIDVVYQEDHMDITEN